MLPTPTVSDKFTGNLKSSQQKVGSMHSVTLPQAVAMLPTARASDYKGTRTPEGLAKAGRTMSNSLGDTIVGTDPGLKLRPRFVEWMMGFPDDWTNLD